MTEISDLLINITEALEHAGISVEKSSVSEGEEEDEIKMKLRAPLPAKVVTSLIGYGHGKAESVTCELGVLRVATIIGDALGNVEYFCPHIYITDNRNKLEVVIRLRKAFP